MTAPAGNDHSMCRSRDADNYDNAVHTGATRQVSKVPTAPAAIMTAIGTSTSQLLSALQNDDAHKLQSVQTILESRDFEIVTLQQQIQQQMSCACDLEEHLQEVCKSANILLDMRLRELQDLKAKLRDNEDLYKSQDQTIRELKDAVGRTRVERSEMKSKEERLEAQAQSMRNQSRHIEALTDERNVLRSERTALQAKATSSARTVADLKTKLQENDRTR